jgi:hypothetical protein
LSLFFYIICRQGGIFAQQKPAAGLRPTAGLIAIRGNPMAFVE